MPRSRASNRLRETGTDYSHDAARMVCPAWKRVAFAAAAAALLYGPSPAASQVLGTGDVARHAGLGGGLALQGASVATQVNPAALAASTDVRVLLPRVLLGLEGELSEDILKNVIEYRDFEHLPKLGVDLTNERNVVWTGVGAAVRVEQFEIGLEAGGRLEGTPNRPLRRWARQGHFGVPPPASRLVTQFGYYGGVPVSYGQRFQLPGRDGGTLDLGGRLLISQGTYQRDQFRTNRRGKILRRLQDRSSGTAAALDLGARFIPARNPRASYAAVLRGIGTAGIGSMRHPVSLDLGAALRLDPDTTFVADAAALGSSGFARLSVGAEYHFPQNPITFRGAFTSRGLAMGVDLGPLSLSYSADGSSMARTGIKF